MGTENFYISVIFVLKKKNKQKKLPKQRTIEKVSLSVYLFSKIIYEAASTL